jgi:hypothetical protein
VFPGGRRQGRSVDVAALSFQQRHKIVAGLARCGRILLRLLPELAVDQHVAGDQNRRAPHRLGRPGPCRVWGWGRRAGSRRWTHAEPGICEPGHWEAGWAGRGVCAFCSATSAAAGSAAAANNAQTVAPAREAARPQLIPIPVIVTVPGRHGHLRVVEKAWPSWKGCVMTNPLLRPSPLPFGLPPFPGNPGLPLRGGGGGWIRGAPGRNPGHCGEP